MLLGVATGSVLNNASWMQRCTCVKWLRWRIGTNGRICDSRCVLPSGVKEQCIVDAERVRVDEAAFWRRQMA